MGANGADGGNGITQRSRETEVEQRTVFSVCVSVAPFLCVIPLPPCSPFTHARELEQCRRERSVIEIAAARRNQRIHEGSSACVRHRAPGADAGRAPAEIQPKSRVFGLGCTNRECSLLAVPGRSRSHPGTVRSTAYNRSTFPEPTRPVDSSLKAGRLRMRRCSARTPRSWSRRAPPNARKRMEDTCRGFCC